MHAPSVTCFCTGISCSSEPHAHPHRARGRRGPRAARRHGSAPVAPIDLGQQPRTSRRGWLPVSHARSRERAESHPRLDGVRDRAPRAARPRQAARWAPVARGIRARRPEFVARARDVHRPAVGSARSVRRLRRDPRRAAPAGRGRRAVVPAPTQGRRAHAQGRGEAAAATLPRARWRRAGRHERAEHTARYPRVAPVAEPPVARGAAPASGRRPRRLATRGAGGRADRFRAHRGSGAVLYDSCGTARERRRATARGAGPRGHARWRREYLADQSRVVLLSRWRAAATAASRPSPTFPHFCDGERWTAHLRRVLAVPSARRVRAGGR